MLLLLLIPAWALLLAIVVALCFAARIADSSVGEVVAGERGWPEQDGPRPYFAREAPAQDESRAAAVPHELAA